MILIASFIGFEKSNINSMILGFILVPLPLLVSVVFKEDSIGGADIKLTAVCSFLLGFERGLIAVILGLALAILNTLALRKLMKKDIRESFPVVPYLAVGSLMAYLI
jgi:leader peptidase (prepilin peptidase)/N-methyltransferase